MNIEKENFDTESDALERTTELRTAHSNESFDSIEKDKCMKENFDGTENYAPEREFWADLRNTHPNENFDGSENYSPERELRRHQELHSRKRISTAPRTTRPKENFVGTENCAPE
ncbi:hypothetical protein PoB_002274800 [Plakobranchus ocellatus]|uniref:Uncharacterized protein n=1 Tax=Plakobranchus ocellatus TaxID=259542 RepID=A0AAV3ZN33_9GAST|nr:hypothetical protein PoB_002274800 [Plakobranchus ocellatus]